MIAAVNGVRLNWGAWGEGLPVLAHHGGPGSDHHLLAPFLSPLADYCRLVWFDHRGTGDSSAPRDPAGYCLDSFVQDLEDLRRHLRMEKIGLLGHSFGGMIAQLYALSYPERLSHLVLVCTAASHHFIEQGTERMPGIVGPQAWDRLERISRAAPTAQGMREAFELQAPAFFRDPKAIREIELDSVKWGPGSVSAWQELARFDVRDRLGSIACPTLIIAGRHDRGIPLSFSEEMAGRIRGAKLEVSEAGGHFPFIEDRAWFLKVVRCFLRDKRKAP